MTVASNAGFCFGVSRAADRLEELLSASGNGTRICTLGALIHNPTYLSRLYGRGVTEVTLEDAASLAASATPGSPVVLLIRTHGICRADSDALDALSRRYPDFSYVDMTCPFVKRIQTIAARYSDDDTLFVLLGSPSHPEVRSILSYVKGKWVAAETAEEIADLVRKETGGRDDLRIVAVSQTTQNEEEWKKTQKNLKTPYTNTVFFDTICNVTEKRQSEAAELARQSDCMIVIGGKNSANTAQLYRICRQYCPLTYWIEKPDELPTLPAGLHSISITAGASTPVDIILEVQTKMSIAEETLSFEEMLDGSLKSLHTGEVVTGIVTEISDVGIYLDLGAKVTGFIPAEQVTDDYQSVKLRDMFKVGDEIKAFVIRVDDTNGMATLSKKRVDQDQNWFKLVEKYESGEILEGVIAAAVKGGVIITLGDQKAFIPASHTGLPRDAQLDTLVGTTQKVKLIDIDEHRKRALASIRLARSEARKAEQEAAWANLEVGKHYKGRVKNLTTYGAFVDIGGVDGMVHNSELSWKHIKHPSQVVSVGDEIDVYIKELDYDKKRISLGYKTDEMDTWSIYIKDHEVGDVVDAKITSMLPFGAFAEVYPGVEGLIHISRIAMEKIAKPEDKLTLGEVVKVKITDIDRENRKLSLSIRALLEEDAKKQAEAAKEAAKDAAAKEAAEEQARLDEERAEMAPYIVGSVD